MKLALLLIGCIFVASCVSSRETVSTVKQDDIVELTMDSSTVFVASYTDFGPPQLSKTLLGNKWWQWDDPDNHTPVKYDVKVVVYKGVDISVIERSFPVIPNQKQDYRYVTYETAVEYFDRVIAELESELAKSSSPEEAGLMYIYPMRLYKTVLAMERKLK